MNDKTEKPVEQPIDAWNQEFLALIKKAQTLSLYAPDVLFILQRAGVEMQHNINSMFFSHEHRVNEEQEGE